MKILWVTPNFLHPTTKGGQIRTLEMLRQLHSRHEIHYVAYEDPEHPEGVERSHEYCTRAYPVCHSVSTRGSLSFLKDAVVNLFTGLPLSVSRFKTLAMTQRIAELREREHFDSLVCDFLFPAPNIPDLDRWVLFQHNVESVIWQRRVEHAENAIQKRYLASQHRRMCEYEGHVCRDSAFVIAVSDVDAASMKTMYKAERIGAVPTGVDTEYFAPPSESTPRAGMAFIGSMDWMPNIDGVRYFVDEVLPLIRGHTPAAALSIVGRRPPPEILALAEKDPNIHVTGTVPDVRPYLWEAAVSIVPLRIGGGTRLKIYEAMAAGAPVVSTTIGAEGLKVRPPRDIRVADTPEGLARECLDLLTDWSARQSVATAARQLVESVCSWSQVVQTFEDYLEQATGKERIVVS